MCLQVVNEFPDLPCSLNLLNIYIQWIVGTLICTLTSVSLTECLGLWSHDENGLCLIPPARCV